MKERMLQILFEYLSELGFNDMSADLYSRQMMEMLPDGGTKAENILQIKMINDFSAAFDHLGRKVCELRGMPPYVDDEDRSNLYIDTHDAFKQYCYWQAGKIGMHDDYDNHDSEEHF